MHSVFNANSLALFRSLTSGADYPMVVLSQVNSSGQTIASWSLGLVVVTSDDVSGDGSGASAERGILPRLRLHHRGHPLRDEPRRDGIHPADCLLQPDH